MATYTVQWDKDGDGSFSTDISGYVMDCKIERGRQTDIGSMPPGTATLVLNNADGRFSPDKAAGAYYPDVEMYRRCRVTVNHSATDYGLFYGYVIGWDNKPKTTEQTVTWFLGDRFALMQDMALKQPLLRKLPIKCALDLALNRAMADNQCSNPSVEQDLDGYTGMGGNFIDTYTPPASGDDGQIAHIDDESYAECRGDTPDTNTAIDDGEITSIGQAYSHADPATTWSIFRGYMRFNTAAIPDAASITSAKLRVYVWADYSTDSEFTIVVKKHIWSGGGLTTADWRTNAEILADTTLGTSASTSTLSAPQWLEITLDTSEIVKDGYTEMYLLSSRDAADGGTDPKPNATSGVEYIRIYTEDYDSGSKAPELVVEYPVAITPVRDPTMKIEGDYTLKCDCPGNVASQGWRYDATGQVTHSEPIIARVWAKASETATLRFQAVDSVGGVLYYVDVSVGTTPTLLSFTSPVNKFAPGSNHYFDLITESATVVTFWSDGLYFVAPASLGEVFTRNLDVGTVEIELAASYRQPGLELLQAIAESEPCSLLFFYCDNTNSLENLRFYDKDYRATAIAAGPVATFSDDGADLPYHDLVLGEDAIDRISEVEVVSAGDFLDENEEATVWELSPIGQLVAAAATVNYRARYSQPARDCSLTIDPMLETFEIPAEASDGYAGYNGAAWPPDVWASNTTEDQAMIGSLYVTSYMRRRTYLRFDTSGIPDGATVTSAKLRLCLKVNATTTDFVLRIRDKAWLAGGLTEADWSAVPGGDALVGSFDDTGDLPPVDQWFEIDIDDLTKISKVGNSEWYLASSREEAATEPTGLECIYIWTYQTEAKRPRLIVNYSGLPQGSSTFKNYGVGADISITAGASPLYVTAVEVKGKPLKGTSEESKVIAAAPSPPPVDRTLSLALPLQGSRTASMEAEATRLAARYDGRIRRPALTLKPVTSAVLTQMLVREIGDLIHLENIGDAYGTWIDGKYWIEGIEHSFEEDGSSHETVFYLEEVGSVTYEGIAALAGGGTLGIAGVCTLVGTAPLAGEGTLAVIGTV